MFLGMGEIMIKNLLAAAVLACAAPVAGFAATTHFIQMSDGPSAGGIANSILLGPGATIESGVSASVTVIDIQNDAEEFSFLGFPTFPATGVGSTLAVSLDALDAAYAGMSVNIWDDMAKTMLLGSGTVPLAAPLSVVVNGAAGTSPIWVELDWSGLGISSSDIKSFNYDVTLVPVPAAGFLLLGGLGGLAALRRRKKA